MSAAPREAPEVGGKAWLVGHLPAMRQGMLALLDRARDDVGDIARVQLGPRSALVLSSPTAIERVLVENQRNYNKQSRGYQKLRLMLGNGLVTSEGSFWLRQRRIMQPAFHRDRIAAFQGIIERDTDEMLARWQRDRLGANAVGGVSAPFDVAHELMQLTMRIIAEALFSVDVSGDANEAGAAINELIHQAFERITSLSLAPMWLPTPMNRRFRASKRVLDTLVYGIIDGRRRGEDRPDLLSMLLHAVDDETGERMTDEQLRDEVLTLFSAGHETTANLLAWTLLLLIDNPGWLARVRAELATLTDAARLDALLQLPVLDAVLKESMRVYPPIPLVTRAAVEDDVLDGVRVHSGDFVFCPQWTVHRHPRLWPDPLRFDPARFLADDAGRHRYAHFPFLGGPRKCIGDQLALLEAKLILKHMLTRFSFARADHRPITPEPTVSLRPKGGLAVTIAEAPR